MAYTVMAYTVMAYIVMAYIAMAHIVMAYIVMAHRDRRNQYRDEVTAPSLHARTHAWTDTCTYTPPHGLMDAHMHGRMNEHKQANAHGMHVSRHANMETRVCTCANHQARRY